MAALIIAFALAGTAASSPEAQRLGYELAQQGTLAALLPLVKANDTEELVREDPGLSAEQQAQLRALSDRLFKSGCERLMTVAGDAYARRLTVGELKTLVRFNRTPAAARYRQIAPEVIAETMKTISKMDFKADVRSAFCAQTGRLCLPK